MRYFTVLGLPKNLWLVDSGCSVVVLVNNIDPDSDVDVAIELDMSAVKGVDESGGMATWAFDAKPWKPELEDLLSLIVDLQRYKAGETRIVQAGLDQSSILVYEKQKREILV